MSTSAIFRDVLHTHTDFWIRDPKYQIGQRNAFLRQLRQKKRFKTDVNGGDQVRVPIVVNENRTIQNYAAFGLLNNNHSDIMESITFPWSQKAITVTLSGRHEMVNNGPAAIVNLLSVQMETAKRTAENRLAIELFADGTTNDALAGLKAMVTDAGTGTVGGLNSSLVPNWKNQWVNAGAPASITSSTVKQLFNKCWGLTEEANPNGSDIILLTNDIYTAMEDSLLANQQFHMSQYMDGKEAEFGFKGLRYKDAVIIRDSNTNFGLTGERGYFLNSEGLNVWEHPKRRWTETDPITPVNQDSMVSRLLWMGSFGITSRRDQLTLFTS